MKVVWLHNNRDRSSGSFMWDIYDALEDLPGVEVQLKSIPVVRTWDDLLRLRQDLPIDPRAGTLAHAQYGSLVGLAARLTGLPYLLSLRGSDMYPPQGRWRERLTGRIRLIFSWFAARRAKAILVMSEAMRRRLRRWPGLARKPIHLLPDPAGRCFWQQDRRVLGQIIRETELRIVVAALAADNPVKRMHIVRRAAELCQSAGLKVELQVLAGVSREQVREAVEASDLLALASTHEGWPNIVKEGLLLGKPFVATDVSDLSEIAATSGSRIVGANPVDFALAFVDMLAQKAYGSPRLTNSLIQFHPDVCVLKHLIVYKAYETDRRP